MAEIEDDGAWRKRARNTDPETSKKAARSVGMRASSQKAKLLRVFGDANEPLTSEEACIAAGINIRSCHWRRCGELANDDGLLEVFHINGVKYTKKSSLGEHNVTYVITPAGRRKLKELFGG
jgi:hypothetical protein